MHIPLASRAHNATTICLMKAPDMRIPRNSATTQAHRKESLRPICIQTRNEYQTEISTVIRNEDGNGDGNVPFC